MNIRYLLISMLCSFSLCSAEIKEIKSMAELCDPIADILAANKKLLIVFDIDDTLACPEHELGSSTYFYQELERQQAQPGVDKQKVLYDLIALHTHINNFIPLKAVEERTPLFILFLQSLGIPCMALTARSHLIERTFEQLSPLGIDFTITALSTEDMVLSDNPELPARYTRGIIFNGNNNKGETLLKYLHAINYTPDYVLYVDDSANQVEKVNNALAAAGIPCTTYHYSYMETVNASFNSAAANTQLNAFLQEHPFTPTTA